MKLALRSIVCLLVGLLFIGVVAAQDKVVVFVPGILGSKLTVDGKPVWGQGANNEPELRFAREQNVVAEPLDDFTVRLLIDFKRIIYGDLISEINASLSAPHRFLPFAYDWRGPNAEAAKLLHTFLCTASQQGNIVLVAHSMGGLVVKHWLADGFAQPCANGETITIDSIVFAATPHQGSPQAVMSLISDVVIDARFNWLVADGINDVGYSFDSLYELLPPDETCFKQGQPSASSSAIYFDASGNANPAKLFDAGTYESLGIFDRFESLAREEDPHAYLEQKLLDAHDAICKLATMSMPDFGGRVYYLGGFGEIDDGQRPRDTIRQLEFYSADTSDDIELSLGQSRIGLKLIRGVGDGTVPLPIALNGNPEFLPPEAAQIITIRADHQSILNSSQFKGLVAYLLNGPTTQTAATEATSLSAIGKYATERSLAALVDRQAIVEEIGLANAWLAVDAPVRYAFAKETQNPVLFEAVGADAQLGPVYQAWAMQNAAYFYAQKNLALDALRASANAEALAADLSLTDRAKILPALYTTRGAVQLFVGNLSEAEMAYRAALEADPNSSIAKLGLGRISADAAEPLALDLP